MSVKVKFLKNHVNGIKKDDVGEFEIGRAKYLVRVGVAEYIDTKEVKEEEKKERKSKKEAGCKTC